MNASIRMIFALTCFCCMLMVLTMACSAPTTTPATPTQKSEPTVAATSPAPPQPPAVQTPQTTTDAASKSAQPIPVPGTSAIFLAGRSDLAIPKPGDDPGEFPITHCGGSLVVTFPIAYPIPVSRKLTFNATGGIDFYGNEKPAVEPDGDPGATADIEGLGGISGYKGQCGALVGVFLDDANPGGLAAPETLDFTEGGMGRSFRELKPLLRQVFYIGNGMTQDDTGAPAPRTFTAPEGATRLFLGIADAPVFQGAPGCYDDNIGEYRIAPPVAPTSAEPAHTVP